MYSPHLQILWRIFVDNKHSSCLQSVGELLPFRWLCESERGRERTVLNWQISYDRECGSVLPKTHSTHLYTTYNNMDDIVELIRTNHLLLVSTTVALNYDCEQLNNPPWVDIWCKLLQSTEHFPMCEMEMKN